MDIQDIYAAYRAAEEAGDLDGCAACVLAAVQLATAHPEAEGTEELAYFEDGRLMVVLAAAIFAMERGDDRLADYYLRSFPQGLLYESAWFPEGRYFRGVLALRAGDFRRARELLGDHLAQFAGDAAAWLAIGNAAYHMGAFLPAVVAYGKALEQRADLPEAAVNRDVALAQMLAPEGAARPPIHEGLTFPMTIEAEDWEAVRHLPIFINCRDRVDCLSRLVTWLCTSGYDNIILIDNASTYPPLLRYYETIRAEGVRVVRLGSNLGHTALWASRLLELLDIRTPYVYTDPDVLPTEACPAQFLQAFLRVLQEHPLISKVGAALAYEDLTYEYRERKAKNERRFYHVPLGGDAYYANVDTTFALYRDARFYHRGPAIRMAGPYTFRHLPWYYDSDHLPEDESYYLAHANGSSSTKAWMEKKVAE